MSEEGNDDALMKPKRKIKKFILLSSDSSSDGDESIGVVATRRKRLRVASDDGSESSGSSVVYTAIRRNRPLPKLRDSDEDSDTSGWATDHSDHNTKPAPTTVKPISGFASDSSEGNSDKCSICLLRFTNQEIGTPQSCEHVFCLDCITEWSKNVNTCPVDRMTFDALVVRACLGGRVLRIEPVKVTERRSSIELLVIEDPTICEICGRTDNEETMLLCDACDLGYHMQCLTPPLAQVPPNQWICVNCHDLLSVDIYQISNFTDADFDVDHNSRFTRATRSRNRSVADGPSTSTGRRGRRTNSEHVPSSSRGPRTSHTNSRGTTSRSSTAYRTNRTRRKRTRTKTVIIEYELQENGKFPVKKQVKRKLRKRKIKRRTPRTAARRSHVRASVRARLATLTAAHHPEPLHATASASNAQDLSIRRQRAGIPALSLFGDSHHLDYFSEDEEHWVSEGASIAFAARPTSSVLSAYRQARRKMTSIPSPPVVTAAPDILSSILESQTLLHSKKAKVSIAADGNLNIKLESRPQNELPQNTEPKKEEKVDLSQGEDAAKKVPSYPGQSRGGGWGGGYRGSYHREQNTNNFNRGGNNENNSYGGGYQNRQNNLYHGNNLRRDDNDAYSNYSRRPQYPHNDDVIFDRNRRPELNRHNPSHNQRQNDQNRYSIGPSWQPYTPPTPGPRQDMSGLQHRHSFGGFENPLDMRMGHIPRQNSVNTPMDVFSGIEASQPDKPHQSYQPLPEPPMFKFDKQDVDKSEDEKSDSGLIIDTEKYDPTEPTNDDSGDEDKNTSVTTMTPFTVPPLPEPPEMFPSVPPSNAVQSIIAGLDTSTMNVHPNVLDSAVRQVLKEHRNLIVAPPVQSQDKSDDDSDGDCPNFSIYSATSVHIANNTISTDLTDAPNEQHEDNLEDLVQEDDETPRTTPELVETESKSETNLKSEPTTVIKDSIVDNNKLKKSDEELKEKVSKRCPITTNPRNPIKIKLNTPSLIKRQVTLYDEEEDMNEDIEETTEPTSTSETINDKPLSDNLSQEEENMTTKLNQDNSKFKSINSLDIVENEEELVQKQMYSPNEAEDESPRISDVDDEQLTKENDATIDVDRDETRNNQYDSDEEAKSEQRCASPEKSTKDTLSDFNDELSDTEDNDIRLNSPSPEKSIDRNEDNLEKMTESISETEDERSYTPCLDENKSKDTSLEIEKDKGIEGLDTEMISEDEGNEMFSDTERVPSEPRTSPRRPIDDEEGEILDKKRETHVEESKKKKKKESKKEGKEKRKSKKTDKAEVTFKKLSKSGKERNYRERDKDKDKEGKSKRERRDSSEGERQKRRKERRKDLERYDVRTVVTEKRRRPKDPFGRDVSPRARSRSPSLSPPRRSASPSSRPSPRRSPRLSTRRSPRLSPRRSPRRSPRLSPRRSPRRSPRLSPRRSPRRSPRISPRARRASTSPPRRRATPLPRSLSPRRVSPRRISSPRHVTPPRARRRRRSDDKRPEPRRRRSAERSRKRRASPSGSRSPRPKPIKRKKRARSVRSAERRRAAPRRRKLRRRSASPSPAISPVPDVPVLGPGRSGGSVDSRLLSPRTPPPEPSPPPEEHHEHHRRDLERPRHRRLRETAGPSKEVFTSGDNILVSVSFKDQERSEGESRRERRRERRRRRRRAPATEVEVAARPVAIIDLERSPFRELTPSPRNVIVLSDSEPGDKENTTAAEPTAAAPIVEPPHPALGPQTPPSPVAPAPTAPECGPSTPPEPPDSPDAYDPYEPTRSASASPASARAASPQRTMMTLETAQKTNMSADDVIDRRPLSPIEKVMALLQSTRDVSPDPPPSEPTNAGGAAGAGASAAPVASAAASGEAPALVAAILASVLPAPALAAAPAPPVHSAPPVRIVLPSPTRAQPPKLFLAKPSPIKSDPIKPMQHASAALQLAKAAKAGGAAVGGRRRSGSSVDSAESPYSPGSSDFGDLFEPPGGVRSAFDALVARPRKRRSAASKVPVKFNRKKGKTQVGVKIDENNLKILDDLPSSAVEMQVKSKFLKKLNRQERVVEEVKLVLKPHYNKKHVTKDEYKDILRRAVPKICHNKTGEINPSKIQALVEAYVRKFRKKHKLGLA